MTLDTSVLFQMLIRLFKPELICDVGSMDAAAARRFRRLTPRAQVVAFEANPHNAQTMRADARNVRRRLEILHKVVWNRDGRSRFCVEHLARPTGWDPRQAISSTRNRTKGSLGHTSVTVDSVRLDTFVIARPETPKTIALWIDVEGAACEVLEGIEGIRKCVQLIHVEVETREFWLGQKLKIDVQNLMRDFGFTELARGYYEPQHDLVYVNTRLFAESRLKIMLAVRLARLLSVLSVGRYRDRLSRRWLGWRDWYSQKYYDADPK